MRKQNSIKNFLTDLLPNLLFAVLGFIQVRIFIRGLGEEIYSLNQLFIQIFSYISLVEGGVGAIICQKYYKHFVNNNEDDIVKVYASSVKSMKKISLVIFGLGIIVSFFLNYLTNNSLSLQYMQIVFLLYIIRSIIEYLNLSPRFVIQADQKLYKINLTLNFYKLLEVVVTILLLLNGADYLFILVITILIKLIMYHFVNKIIYNLYPYLKKYKNFTPQKIKGIGYMYYHKIAGAVYNNVDIILISAKLSPFNVTMYSSYNYICKYINDIVYMLGNSVMASLGNVIYKENSEKSFKIFEELNSFFLFLASFCAINVYLLADSFVGLWVGKEYSKSANIALLMAVLLFFTISKRILALVCEVKGLYKETRIIVVAEAIVNLILSFILIYTFGINGVICATIISYLVTTFWYYPKYVYKNIFNEKIGLYFKKYIFLLMVSILIAFIMGRFPLINVTSFWMWLLLAILDALFSGVIIFSLCYIFISPFKRVVIKVLEMIRRKKL